MTAFDAYNIGKGLGGLLCLWGALLMLCAFFSTDDSPPSYWVVHVHMVMVVVAILICI